MIWAILFVGWLVGGLVFAARKNPELRLHVVYALAFLLVVVIFSRYFGIVWASDDQSIR